MASTREELSRHPFEFLDVHPHRNLSTPEESIWVRALRWFQGILRRLQQRCRDVLTWLREKAAAFLEAVCSAARAVHRVLRGCCSSEGQHIPEASSRFRNSCCEFFQARSYSCDLSYRRETSFAADLQ